MTDHRTDLLIRIQVATITPKQAEALLLKAAGARQRPRNEARVRQYARKMKDGQWMATHQPIAIDPDGIVFDGQHRIAAIALAGVPVTLTVAYDADPKTFDVVDTGRVRSPGHTLTIAGYTNVNVIAAATRYYLVYASLENTTNMPTAEVRATWTAHDILRFMESAGGERLLGALKPAEAIAIATGRIGTKTWLAAGIALLDARGVDPVLRTEFLERLENGTMLAAGSPILSFRRWLVSENGYDRARYDLRGFIGMACLIEAWNMWLNDETTGHTGFKIGASPLPRVEQHRTTLEYATA
jgi:hypothetical protein